MKSKDKAQLHQSTVSQLQAKLGELETQLVETRLKLAADRIKDVHAPAKIRRQIAIIKTILTQKASSK